MNEDSAIGFLPVMSTRRTKSTLLISLSTPPVSPLIRSVNRVMLDESDMSSETKCIVDDGDPVRMFNGFPALEVA